MPHAVTPWLYASITNRARENAWALFKDLDLFERVEPYPHRETPFRETVFDRLASSAHPRSTAAPSRRDDARTPRSSPSSLQPHGACSGTRPLTMRTNGTRLGA